MKAGAPKKLERTTTYAEAGVDRELRARSKKALQTLEKTYRFSQCGAIVRLPYGNIFPVGGDMYLDLVIEEVGTKVLIAQLADKYDTIGIDGVAMAVNDIVRSGAEPLAVADNIDAHSSHPVLVKEWMKGIVKGASEARCIVSGGEIGDVPELVKGLVEGKGFNMIVASIGNVHKKRIVFGNNLKSGDAVIGLRSSGIHSNGVSLARKILFKQWSGAFEPFDVPEGLDREAVYEVLEPTRIYVRPVLRLVKEHLIKATVHITGDAYLKFEKLMGLNKRIGFEFDSFKPQPVFKLIQQIAEQRKMPISDEEMFKTFNMGWGFSIIVDNSLTDKVIDILEKEKTEADIMGKVTSTEKIIVKYDGKTINLIQQ